MREGAKEGTLFFKKRKKRILPAILTSIALPFMLFISVPFDIYCHNLAEFEFSIGNFALFNILFFVAFAILNFCLLYFTPKTVYRIASALLLGVLLMCFIQMNFMNGSISSLQGDDLGQTVATSTIVINTIIWAVVLAGAIVAFLLVPKKNIIRIITIAISAVLLLAQIVSIVSLSISTKGFGQTVLSRLKEEDPDYVPTFLTTENITTISKNRNVFVFCIDRFDGMDYAEPAMNEYPEIFENLSGFTYFNDNLSMYGHTYPSVCYMITGEEFEGEKRKDYFDNAYSENKTISKLNELGYMINVYTDSYHGYYNAYYLPDYIDNMETASLESITYKNKTAPYILSARMTQISFVRCLPYLAKDLPGSVSTDALNGEVTYQSEELEYPESSIDMKFLFDQVNDKPFTLTDQNVFSFVHLSGCHSIDYNEDFEKTSREKDINVSIKNSFKIINEYIDALKTAGVYDEATIIITADHGNATAATDTTSLKDQRLAALFVKPSKSSQGANYSNSPLKTSSALVSHEDLWATIFESENLSQYKKENTNSVFYYMNNERVKPRKFVWHTWNLTASNSSEYVYKINGSARIFDNWEKVSQKDLNRYLFD